MRMRGKSLTGPVVALYAVKGVLVAAIFVSLLLSLLTLRADNTNTRSASNLLIGALSAERSAVDLQNGVRGYMLTGDASFLAPYQTARAALPGQLAVLSSDAQSPGQRATVSAIRVGVAAYESKVARMALAAGPQISGAEQVRLSSRGNVILGKLRARFQSLDQAIVRLRRRRRAAANGVVTRSIVIAAVGLALSLAVELGVAAFVLRGVLGPIRRVSRAAARLAGGDLAARVPGSGKGEIAVLADSFNQMAASTESRTTELAGAQERLARAVAAAEEASAMKSNFVANISHEIRTPLNGLVGMLTLLSDTELDEEQGKYVEIARSSSDALMAVVNDVLDIAKIEAGRLELERLDFDLHDTVEAVCDLMTAAARAKDLQLQAFVHDDVPRGVCGDRTRVAQVLQNLVSNAVKFTPEGEVVVEAACVGESDGVVRVRFEVRDTGIGIDGDRLTALFEPFTQAEAGTTRKYGGTGLGLAISRELTELMGGTIGAHSEPGAGSTFSFELPFSASIAGVPAAGAAPALDGVRALVLDDNETNRRIFAAYVEGAGMRPTAVATVADGLASLRTATTEGDPFGIALIDLNLAGESGLTFAREVRSDPDLPDLDLILLTSSAGSRADDPPLGIRRRLTKPVRRARLLEVIGEVLGENGAVDRPLTGEVTDSSGADGAGPEPVPTAIEARPAARILVAEDHDVNWMLIERMLSTRGHTVERARDGEEVLALAGTAHYDLVLMDCQMPGRDGFDTTRALRRREVGADAAHLAGAVTHVPIVAMTASAMADTRARCLEAGMDDFVAKPISPQMLDAMLERWLPADPSASRTAVTPVLDWARVDELRRLFPGEQLDRVVTEIADEGARDLVELEVAVAAGDQAAAAAAAHRLRNTGRTIGAAALVSAAAAFDHPVHEERPPVPPDPLALAPVRDSWAAARTALVTATAREPARG